MLHFYILVVKCFIACFMYIFYFYVYLGSVSVIRNLCDHNGYTIADHYQISYVIEDYSVLLAIVDHESAMCSQGIIGYV